MNITGININFRYNHHIIFHNLEFEFGEGISGISGQNGVGKSTLLQLISGYKSVDSGQLLYQSIDINQIITSLNIAQYLVFTAPYVHLVQELTTLEFLHHYFLFKPKIANIDLEMMLDYA